MSKKGITNESNKYDHTPLGAIDQIGQLMHWQFNSTQLKRIRDMVISNSHRSWDKKSFLGKALIYHWKRAALGSDNVKYHDLLFAELISTFGIATKKEYLEKCKELRIYPFLNNKKKPSQVNESSLSKEKIVEVFKKAFQEMAKEIEKERKDEVQNAMDQDYPICSIEELNKKTRNN